MRLKVYDRHNRLWKSREVPKLTAAQMLNYLELTTGINKAFITESGKSKPVSLSTTKRSVLSTVYVCSDSSRKLTYPIDPALQPITILHIQQFYKHRSQ